jgi:hypothetical protein
MTVNTLPTPEECNSFAGHVSQCYDQFLARSGQRATAKMRSWNWRLQFFALPVQYRNRQLFVIVMNVVTPQERYEGRIQGFVGAPPALEIDGLKAGCIVGFCHDVIWRVE